MLSITALYLNVYLPVIVIELTIRSEDFTFSSSILSVLYSSTLLACTDHQNMVSELDKNSLPSSLASSSKGTPISFKHVLLVKLNNENHLLGSNRS